MGAALLLGALALAGRRAGAQATPADTGRIAAGLWNQQLASMGDPDQLPLLMRGARTFSVSSFDRSGGNDDGFTGRSSFLYRTGPEWVLLDVCGAGAITRFHFAFFDTLNGGHHEDYSIRFYFDGEVRPRIDLPIKDFVSGLQAPFLFPFAGDDQRSPGGPFAQYPIAFRHSLRIATSGAPNFLDIQGIRRREVRGVYSYDPRYDDARTSRALLEQSGWVRPPRAGEITTSVRAALAPGQPLVLLDARGGGMVTQLVFELGTLPVGDLRLVAFFDGAANPAIDAPLAYMLGDGLGGAMVAAALFGFTPADSRGYLRVPMPFASTARLELHTAAASGVVAVRCDRRGAPPAGDWGTLHAEYREELTPRTDSDVILLDTSGRGKVIAISAAIGHRHQASPTGGRTYFEGDERIYIDGAGTPRVHGTGTEEFFSWGWYDSGHDHPFTLPLHGYPEHSFGTAHDETACYRIFLGDPILFESAIVLGLEHGAHNNVGAEYRTLVLYYAQDQPGLQLSDAIDVGRPASEGAHTFFDPGGYLLPVLAEEYEGDHDTVVLRDEGRRSPGPHTFHVAIANPNDGVRLRRRTDQGQGRQRADVLVDGRRVGTWYLARTSISHRWFDDDFEIPPEFTAGKSSIEVRIEPRNALWNVYRYEVYSYLPLP